LHDALPIWPDRAAAPHGRPRRRRVRRRRGRLRPPPGGGVRGGPLRHRHPEAHGPHLEAGDVGGRRELGARRPAHHRRGGAGAVNPVVFLALAAVIVRVGALVLWARNRTPSSFEASIESFRREMQALAPREEEPPPRRWWRR